MKASIVFFGLLILIILLHLSGCTVEPVSGCMITCASNYDPEAEEDDGSCSGCTNSAAVNFCLSGLFDDGSCILPCEANGTGEITFGNNSNTNSTYDIIWDGAKIATIAPGQESDVFTVAASIQHTLVFQFTNTSDLACTASTPVIAQCDSRIFSCTG